jgi:hypothetical protein
LRNLRTTRRPDVGARGEHEHDEQPEHDDGEERDHEFHVPHGTTGV